MNKTAFLNSIKLICFCALLGAFSGAVLWAFLKLIDLATELIWNTIPYNLRLPFWFPVIFCTLGGLLIGFVRKK